MSTEIGIRLSLYGIRCEACPAKPDFISTNRTLLEMFAHEHVGHGRLLYLATIVEPPEMRGMSANFDPVFKEKV